ncbi:hypothetical protein [Anaeromyxobacter diazotrophicus]|uniref:Uncharacterized protein n=1 Tax=Anaeromyxobacter diazotrophicus TaxID=2590199 RepID=A0A7I9VH24_9BACT|nr:hypothetical protein [Anaeromyxobacter diazotrophicus]GEJ55549.1 hypothetical protein AMYX_02900 [Anaeromyxobacter diazotrophicus]
MEHERTTRTADGTWMARASAIGAGDVSLAVRGELTRLLAESAGDRKKAVHAGLSALVAREAITGGEAKELAAIFDRLFAAPDGSDPELAKRVRSYYRALVLDQASSPAALAVASVLNAGPAPGAAGQPRASAVSKGDALYGGFGALVGAGIGAGFGGPIGAGIGAAVGAAVGVCIAES